MAWVSMHPALLARSRLGRRLVSVACATAATSTTPSLLIFGAGFIGETVAKRAVARGMGVLGTTRRVGEREAELAAAHVRPIVFDGTEPLPDELIDRHLASVTHVLSTVPPIDGVDPVLAHHAQTLCTRMPALRWVGHISTTAVYGAEGDIDESTEPKPITMVENLRLIVENEWAALAPSARAPVHIFRPASVYGPGRGPQTLLRTGAAIAIDKPGHVSSRIHVDDLAAAIVASMEQAGGAWAAEPFAEQPGAEKEDGSLAEAAFGSTAYLLADDEPAPPAEVLRLAAALYGRPPPTSIAYEKGLARPDAQTRTCARALVDSALGCTCPLVLCLAPRAVPRASLCCAWCSAWCSASHARAHRSLLARLLLAFLSLLAAEKKLSAAQRAFWRVPTRVAASAALGSLGVQLRYPSYREGLRATVEVEGPLPPLPEAQAPTDEVQAAPSEAARSKARPPATAVAAPQAAAAASAPTKPKAAARKAKSVATLGEAVGEVGAPRTAAQPPWPRWPRSSHSPRSWHSWPCSVSLSPWPGLSQLPFATRPLPAQLYAEGWSFIRAAEWEGASAEEAAVAAAAEAHADALDQQAYLRSEEGNEGGATPGDLPSDLVSTDGPEGGVLRRLWMYESRVDAYKAYGRIVSSSAYKPEWVVPRLRLEDYELRALLSVEGGPDELAKAARFIAKKAEVPAQKGKAAPTLLEQMEGSGRGSS